MNPNTPDKMENANRTSSQTEMHICGATGAGSTVVEPGFTETLVHDESVLQQASPARMTPKRYLSILALFATLFISAMNASIVATATPTIVKELQAPSGYAWISAAYLLGSTVSSPIWAKLSDIWGRKPILLMSVGGFFFASMICALAKTMTTLIAGRALQGAAGGGLANMVIIAISDMFSMKQRGLWLGMTEIVWAIAGSVAPVLGGVFAQHVSWRWIFWIALPVCALAFALLVFALDVHNPRTQLKSGLKAIDWAGSITILGILIMFLLALNFGGVEYPWNSPTVICLMVFSLAMVFLFVFFEERVSKYPIIPMKLFRNRSNNAILFAGFVKMFCLLSTEFYLPLFFQSALGVSPTLSGVLLLPFALILCLSAFVTGAAMSWSGKYLQAIYAGNALLAVGYGLLCLWTPESTMGLIVGLQLIAGVGLGMLMSPLVVALQATVPQSETATSTATLGLVKYIAAVVGVVAGQAVFQNGMDRRNQGLIDAGIPPEITQLLVGQSASANVGIVSTIADPTQQYLIKEAYAGSLRGLWIMNAALSGAALLVSVFIQNQKLSDQHVETRTGLEKEKVRVPETTAV